MQKDCFAKINEKVALVQLDIRQENVKQKMLPEVMRSDKAKKELISKKVKLIDSREDQVNIDIFNNEVLLVTCARKVFYASVCDILADKTNFQMFNIDFAKDVEICKIIDTSEPLHVQIVAKDTALNILIVVTWDLEMNMETSMFQVKIDKSCEHPENMVVKGMNQKYNYMFDGEYIQDMETNLPIQR